eukprot:TRINITY_DN15090_c0_g1_i2.p2 TRINITY_DN15090_c0_g1~~TRINITY_DN15090_c0_g1_i2.p2  ORF type:complete len:108 (+),score=17.68 TRINITY_DN15090_c0_g1_i2:64-387(+)
MCIRDSNKPYYHLSENTMQGSRVPFISPEKSTVESLSHKMMFGQPDLLAGSEEVVSPLMKRPERDVEHEASNDPATSSKKTDPIKYSVPSPYHVDGYNDDENMWQEL